MAYPTTYTPSTFPSVGNASQVFYFSVLYVPFSCSISPSHITYRLPQEMQKVVVGGGEQPLGIVRREAIKFGKETE